MVRYLSNPAAASVSIDMMVNGQRVRGGPRRRLRHRGLTMVEILVAAVVTTLVVGILWTMTSLGERSTSEARGQADCLQRVMTLVRRLTRDASRAELVLLPGPGQTAPGLMLRHAGGAVESVELTASRRHVVSRNLASGAVVVLADLTDTDLLLAGLQFVSCASGELQVQFSFCDDRGQPVPGLTGLLCSLPTRRRP
jgi:Tfp pilus assembly protein PilV